MLNIGDLPVTDIKIVMNGYNDYEIHLMIVPSEHKSRWTQLKDGESCGCRSYGGYISGNPISFFLSKTPFGLLGKNTEDTDYLFW
jgi:hypothetical protein